MQIAIVKYNAGNIRSVVNALQRIGCNPVITDSPEVLQSADKIIFPGQGAAGETMKYLKEHKLDRLICDLRQPVLGICIGQQLMCRHSEEDNTDCLGIFPVDVKRFIPTDNSEKVPAMGWNNIYSLKTENILAKTISCISYIAFMCRFANILLLWLTILCHSAQL